MPPIRIRSCRVGYGLVTVIAVICLITLCREQRTLALAINTATLAIATCAVSLPIGTLLAVLLVRTDVPGRVFWFACVCSLLFIPLYLQCAGWRAAWGQQGWMTLTLGSLMGSPLLDGWRGAVWVHAMAAVPWVVLFVGASLRFVEAELEEDALLNARPATVFFRVTMPRTLPGIRSGRPSRFPLTR